MQIVCGAVYRAVLSMKIALHECIAGSIGSPAKRTENNNGVSSSVCAQHVKQQKHFKCCLYSSGALIKHSYC